MDKVFRLFVVTIGLVFGAGMARAESAARAAGYLYLSPVPGAPYVSAQTRFVLVRFENITPSEVNNLEGFIKVTGAVSGPHSGATHVATDGRTVIFTMSVDFTQNELVTVTLNPQVKSGGSAGRKIQMYQYQFRITAPMPGPVPISDGLPPGTMSSGNFPDGESSTEGSGGGVEPAEGSAFVAAVINPNGVSVPKDFPTVTISVSNNPSPGYLFLEPGTTLTSGYTVMLDNGGLPIWYRKGRMYDFRIQKNGIITWCSDPSSLGFPAFDQSFNYLKTYQTTNGYLTDGHDLKMREDGTYLMIGYRVNTVNLSLYVPGLSTSGSVTETIIQEFTPSGELIFQWRAWDHYDIRDQLPNTDFSHMNGLDFDEDGNILVSSRHLSEVTKINRDTGDIIWRLSGIRSSFTFVNDSFNGTSLQHNISGLGNNHYMVFDNGNGHSPLISRAVEYQLDLTHMTAKLVWQFRDVPDKYAYWLGNAQRLPTGNTLINFVRPQYPKAIEVDTNGVKHFELSVSPSSDTYRAYRLPWSGAVAVPYLVLEPQQDNVTLIFNKFGDTNVAYFRIYGGIVPSPTNLLATSTTTLKHLTNVVNGVRNYFRVTAVSKEGVESGYSNEEILLVNLTLPGQNMVLNGGFSAGTTPWIWHVTPPATAQLQIAGGLCHFAIASGGTYITDVQLTQIGMKLTQGKEYTFSFDAWSAAPRAFEARVEANNAGGINYSGIQPLVITPVTNHYSFTFTMLSPTDNSARLVFNAGALPHDVYLANVSLRERVYGPGDFDWDGCVGFNDLKILTGEWQKTSGTFTTDLSKDGKVDFADFVRFAQGWTGSGFCPGTAK